MDVSSSAGDGFCGYREHRDPYFVVGREARAMHLNNTILRCVTFVGIRKNDVFTPRATAFFVSYEEDQHRFNHLVTAEHVISGLLTKGHEIWLRFNLENGESTETKIGHEHFRFHPNAEREPTDIAVCPVNLKYFSEIGLPKPEAQMLPLSGEKSFVASNEWAERHIGLGAEIATVGLFRSHYGKNKNVPVVRVGNIAAMPTEPVFTKYAGYIEAYLVEARSIAGLSGSPVFILPETTILALDRVQGRDASGAALLGLMHGHFDVQNLNEDTVIEDDAESTRGIHTGIGVVVPVHKIIETLEHPDLVAERKAVVVGLREKPDAAVSDSFDTGAMPEPIDDAGDGS